MVKVQDFPEEGELVIGTVKDAKNFGAFVKLDEYEGKEGFIHISEVSSGWVKYIRDFIREGQKVVCKVLNVNPAKGHVDLSLKQVNDHQRREKIQQWKNEQKATRLFEIVADRLKMPVDDAYEQFGYNLIETFGTMYGAMEECTISAQVLEDNKMKGEWNAAFIEVANENIVPPFVSITGHVDLSCPLADGVVHISEALSKVEVDEGEVKISVHYVGAPRYRMTVVAPNYKLAEEKLKAAADECVAFIEEHGGSGKFTRKE